MPDSNRVQYRKEYDDLIVRRKAVAFKAIDTTPYDWFDIEFCLIEKSNGKRHEIPEEIFQ